MNSGGSNEKAKEAIAAPMKPWQRRLLGVGPAELTKGEMMQNNTEQTELDLIGGAYQDVEFVIATQTLAPEQRGALERVRERLQALDVLATARAVEEAQQCL